MTLTEALDKYRKMDARERDALVAEKVMGWRRGRLGDHAWWTPEKENTPVLPPFSTDPAADYSVLKHVRERWDYDRRSRFCSALAVLWREQLDRLPSSIMAYEPGDFALASLAALEVSK